MRIIFLLAALMIITPFAVLFAADEEIDAPKKTVVFRFGDISNPVKPDEQSVKPRAESFEFLSLIFPDNLKREIDETGQFTVETVGEVFPVAADVDQTLLLQSLDAAAVKYGAQFIVVGNYSVIKKSLAINCYIYAARAKKIIPVELHSEKLGALLDKTISDLSSKIASEMKQYIIQRAGAPAFAPEENSFVFYQDITIVPEKEGDEIWYTTDGSAPVRGDSKKYKGPVDVRKTLPLRAIAYRDGFYVSNPVQKDLTIKYPLSRFTIGQSFGTMQFLGKWRDKVSQNGGDIFEIYTVFDLANIDSLKEGNFSKNLGITTVFFTTSAESDKSSQKEKGYIWGALGGITYTFRLADFSSIELGLIGGYSCTMVNKTYNGMNGGWRDGFNIPTRYDERSFDPIYGMRTRLNFIWGVLFLHADLGVQRIEFKENPAEMVTLGFGLGVRF
jgi:hypothetical protein